MARLRHAVEPVLRDQRLDVAAFGQPAMRSSRSTELLGGGLCHLSRPRRLHHESHANAEPRQHVDQGVGAEKIDAATQKIADSRLRHAKNLCRFRLFEAL
jgi:hypothetical protein